MDNVGDWLYIVFLIIAAVSGLFSSKDKKKKSRPDILGQPDREIVPNDQPTEGKGFWEILEDMLKESRNLIACLISIPFRREEYPESYRDPAIRKDECYRGRTGAYARRYLQRHRGIEESDHLCGDSKPEVLNYATLIFYTA